MNHTTRPIRIAIHGAAGRMGRQLIAAVAERDDLLLAAAIDAAGSPSVGQPVSWLCAAVRDDMDVVDHTASLTPDGCDVVIDFSTPAATMSLLEVLAGKGIPVVIGTTGLDGDARGRLAEVAADLPLIHAANYSVGVTVTLDLLARAARAFGDDCDIDVFEAHHHHKVDAPSGTALAMGEVLAAARGRKLDEVACLARQGQVGARPPGEIGFATMRGGDIVGEHTVFFAGIGERLEVTHRATDRMIFARGAVRAARWLAEQRVTGRVFDMRDVLGIS
ncbi:MAG: 4-hydroxy-tetrahydrodipicolinate reductase [Gammaproteobacteria bacterium]|nr:MAG: 4-hydroxy-tetrahydrodipicolinate reductase [Gammaproteobacteria bacterium]